MDIKEVVKTAILRNSHEWGDEQAEAVLKAINEAGFLVVPAKAQAVPEGFVVLAIDDMERICRCLDDHAVYITYKASDALESIQKAMTEAQEQK